MENYILTAVCGISVLVNIGLVCLSLKMYTEYFKDKSMRSRDK